MAGIGWQELMIVLLFVGIVPAVVLLAIYGGGGGRPFQLRQWTPLAEGALRDHALRWYAIDGWTPTAGQPSALAFTRRPAPNVGLAILLFLFGVVPGLLYLLLGGRTQTSTILTKPLPDGTEVEIITSAGKAGAARFFNSLHEIA